ncbi:MAG TPA: 4-hydroxythreonine-4-phosphate dehydrogenase PdxA, partial [Candidatus Manganitrophaceae bacterium]
MKPIIAVTMGDPCGIGPEVIVKGLLEKGLYDLCRPFVVGNASWMEKAASLFAPALSIRPIQKLSEAAFRPGRLEVLDQAREVIPFQYGSPAPSAAASARDAIIAAARLALEGKADGMATAPIHKERMKEIGFAFPGHTEFLADLAGAKKAGMMMVGGGLKIMLATVHLSLQEAIAQTRKKNLLESIRLADAALRRDFGLPKPRIAVAALNPHAGEGGLFGEEERREVLPAVKAAQKEGIDAGGPTPADTLFHQLKEGRFDAAVALYHDQALIPIKLLAFGKAVNVTVGLPFIRTSVDHGTAYDIAGKGVADPGSLQEALKLAAQMA